MQMTWVPHTQSSNSELALDKYQLLNLIIISPNGHHLSTISNRKGPKIESLFFPHHWQSPEKDIQLSFDLQSLCSLHLLDRDPALDHWPASAALLSVCNGQIGLQNLKYKRKKFTNQEEEVWHCFYRPITKDGTNTVRCCCLPSIARIKTQELQRPIFWVSKEQNTFDHFP